MNVEPTYRQEAADGGRTFLQEQARQARLCTRRSSVRRLEPMPPPLTSVTCACCGTELQVVWSGVHDGPLALGRNLSDLRERSYNYDPDDKRRRLEAFRTTSCAGGCL